MDSWITYSQHMEKLKSSFSTSANRVTHNSIRQPVIHITTNADCYGILSFIHNFFIWINIIRA